FREDIPILHGFTIPGWSTLLQRAELIPAGAAAFVKDGTVALGAALLLFLLPRAPNRGPILDGASFERMPWGALLLLGSSFVIARAFERPRSGQPGAGASLSTWIANALEGLRSMPLLAQLLVVAL